jgi:hypothetical protein
VADILVADHGYRKVAFADALRAEVSKAWGLPETMLTEPATKEHPISALAFELCLDSAFIDLVWRVMNHTREQMAAPRSPREIMQLWGTEFRRAQDGNYWVKRVGELIINTDFDYEDATINDGSSQPVLARRVVGIPRWVITDCRFFNEVKLVDKAKGLLWKVSRPGHAVPPGSHVSETTGIEFQPDETLDNSGSLPALRDQVNAALNRHFHRQQQQGLDMDRVHPLRDGVVQGEVRVVG